MSCVVDTNLLNTFLNSKGMAQVEIELARSTDEEKQDQLTRLADFHSRNSGESAQWLANSSRP